MQTTDLSFLLTAGIGAALTLAIVAAVYLSPNARDRRKRRRNYGRVITRSRRPTVMLNVNTRGA